MTKQDWLTLGEAMGYGIAILAFSMTLFFGTTYWLLLS